MNPTNSQKLSPAPLNVVFVRHGESEANIVLQADKAGDSSGYTPDFRRKRNADVVLTTKGVSQAKAAGKWIRENILGGRFDGYYVSSFRRARQTAGNLHLPDGEKRAVWKIRDYLREQSWGHMANMSRSEREQKYAEIMARKEEEGYFWASLGGESMADVTFRVKLGIIATLYRELSSKDGIVVSHGNTMWAARIIMEGLTYEKYERLDNTNNPIEKMHNCQILHYTRVDPRDPTHVEPSFNWMRSVCPWDMTLSRNEWQTLNRARFTNKELLDVQ
jgi:broad specificity phosphatase PhoE